jgi:hypothetical protein
MFSYLSIRADMERADDRGLGERALSGEQLRQQAEQAAWEHHMSGR